MKKIGIYILFISFVSFFASCIKNEEQLFTHSAVEFDAATWNANSVGVTYPILTRNPPEGRAVSTSAASDSIMTRRSGTVKLRVNLVGAHKANATEVIYEVVGSATTAVAGTHYAALPGKVTIPANSSFGYIEIQLLNPGPTTGTKDLVLRLLGGNDVTVSTNYNTVGLRITQS